MTAGITTAGVDLPVGPTLSHAGSVVTEVSVEVVYQTNGGRKAEFGRKYLTLRQLLLQMEQKESVLHLAKGKFQP